MDKIAYTPGRLAKKLGVSKGKLMNHLRETGLIEQCFASKSGRWQIPYSVALRISSAETLALPTTPVTRSRRKADAGEIQSRKADRSSLSSTNGTSYQRQQTFPPQVRPNYDYAQIGKTLRVAGVTMPDLIKYVQQQMEVVYEQSQIPQPPFGKGENNNAKRDENQTDEPKSSGSTSSDISNSSTK